MCICTHYIDITVICLVNFRFENDDVIIILVPCKKPLFFTLRHSQQLLLDLVQNVEKSLTFLIFAVGAQKGRFLSRLVLKTPNFVLRTKNLEKCRFSRFLCNERKKLVFSWKKCPSLEKFLVTPMDLCKWGRFGF